MSGALTAREHPDVALVGLGESSNHALELIDRIVREASCPVIALLEGHDREFIDEAAKRGVFAYLVDGDADELQSALDITLCRFAEYHNLQGAFGRRAITERAKGILMERHSDRRATRLRAATRSGPALGPQARRHRPGDRRRARAAAPGRSGDLIGRLLGLGDRKEGGWPSESASS